MFGIISAVATIICNMAPQREEIQQIKQDFLAVCDFPNGLGGTDCMHIPIKTPGQEHLQLNKKRFRSLNVKVISDAHSRMYFSLQSFLEVCMNPTSGMTEFCVDTSMNNFDTHSYLERKNISIYIVMSLVYKFDKPSL